MSDHAAGHTVGDTAPEVDESRRKFLIAATAGTGAVGAVLTAVPFLASWKPSESARAAGLPTEVDLSKLEPKDVSWDAATKTLKVQLPEIEIAGPDVDLAAAQEYGAGGGLSTLTNANQQLDSTNRAKAVADLRKQAQGPVQMRLAHQAARAAVERSFAMPLVAAGFKDAKVVARFPTEGSDEASYLDLSTPYEEAIKEAERRRAAEGQR